MVETTSSHLIENLILFGRLLRGLGMDVNPGRTVDWLKASEYIDLGRKEDFYYSTRCLFVQNRDEIPLFDEAFRAFWRRPGQGQAILDLDLLRSRSSSRRPRFTPPPLRPPGDSSSDQNGLEKNSASEQPVIQATLVYSDREALRRKDFADLTGEELAAIKQLIAELVWQLGMRRSRRLEPGRGPQLDLRKSLRRNLNYGGEFLVLSRLQAKLKRRPLVILADISGSMERYTRLLLHFIYSLSRGLQHRVEAFVFSTRLTRVSHQFWGRSVEDALRQVSQQVPDWSGGTRIGEALKDFNYHWGRRVLGRGAVVLLISDGWDRGDPGLLGQEMARLQRSCYRLIWLNPLLGSNQYEPLTRGMQAALPFIDDFLPVHNLASLEELARHLELIDRGRPDRVQSRGISK